MMRLFHADSLARLSSDESGIAALEFALVAPVLLLGLVGVLDLGIAVYEKMELDNAVQAGARYATVNGWDAQGIQNAVQSATGLVGVGDVPAPAESCGCPDGAAVAAAICGAPCPGGGIAGTYVTISAQHSYAPMFPYPGLATPPILTAQVMVRIQ